jgi:PAS domain S-box-containing protein
LLHVHREDIWEALRPVSGSINTVMFIVVGSVTLYFERSWKIYNRIISDQQALKAAHNELIFLNRNLEKLVEERTLALTRSEHNYRRIFEVSRDMIIVTKKDGSILDINPAGLKMLGHRNGETLAEGTRIQNFFDNPEDWDRLCVNLNNHGFTTNDEIKIKVKDGSVRRSLISSGVDRAHPEKDAMMHFMIKDIEQRRMMEQQMTQADKLASIGQLSAGIAHEINNPLGIILGYTQLLLRNESSDDARYQDLKTIEKHVRACKSIVEDLLNFARSSKPTRNKVRLNEALEDVITFIQHHSIIEDIEIIKYYDADLPPMVLDEKKIKQVFMNLIMNAKHAVGKKGRITLSTHCNQENRTVVVEVMDTGYGIKKKNLERVFDPFFTTKPTGEGTGLGLSVSYGIVKSHGGELFVDSEAGKGTTFQIVLPID